MVRSKEKIEVGAKVVARQNFKVLGVVQLVHIVPTAILANFGGRVFQQLPGVRFWHGVLVVRSGAGIQIVNACATF